MKAGKSVLRIIQKYYPNVTKVSDSTKDASIDVTEDDCKESTSKKPDECAMARAFKRQYDGAIISLTTAYLIKGNKAIRFQVPHSVSREIVSFDRHHNFEPGTYSLYPPSTKLGPRRYKLDPNRNKKDYPQDKKRVHRTSGVRSL